jgi:hypothetical protein
LVEQLFIDTRSDELVAVEPPTEAPSETAGAAPH